MSEEQLEEHLTRFKDGIVDLITEHNPYIAKDVIAAMICELSGLLYMDCFDGDEFPAATTGAQAFKRGVERYKKLKLTNEDI